MKIAILGAYGTGKTTLSNHLSKYTNLPITVLSPMSNPYPFSPKALSDCTIEEVMSLVVRRYHERTTLETSLSSGFISDGSLLHEWIYLLARIQTLYVDSKNQYETFVSTSIDEVAARLPLLYDAFIYCPPEFSLPQGSPIGKLFQDSTAYLHEKYLTRHEIPFTTVSGNPPERLTQAVKAL